jgi:hypothetical protein
LKEGRDGRKEGRKERRKEGRLLQEGRKERLLKKERTEGRLY